MTKGDMQTTMTRGRKCGQPQKPERPFPKSDHCDDARRTKTVSKPSSGQRLRRDVQMAALAQEVQNLRQVVAAMQNLIDPAEIAAAIRLKKISPTITELRLWTSTSEPPAHLSTLQEDCPF